MTDSPDRIKAGEYAVWVFAVSEGSVWGHMTQCAWAEHTHTSVNVSWRILLTSQEPGSGKSRILCPKGKKETGTVHFQQAALLRVHWAAYCVTGPRAENGRSQAPSYYLISKVHSLNQQQGGFERQLC